MASVDRRELTGTELKDRSGGVWLYLGHHEIADCAFGNGQLIRGLEVEPEASAVSEIPPKSKCGFRRNPALAIQDIRDPAGWQPQCQRKPVSRKVTRAKLSL